MWSRFNGRTVCAIESWRGRWRGWFELVWVSFAVMDFGQIG